MQDYMNRQPITGYQYGEDGQRYYDEGTVMDAHGDGVTGQYEVKQKKRGGGGGGDPDAYYRQLMERFHAQNFGQMGGL
jgi:hypothetical protein